MLGVPKQRGTSHHAVRDGCPQLLYVLCFDRLEPQGREIAKYGHFRPFWPRTAFGTERNPGCGLTTEKRNFLALGVPKLRKKRVVVRNFFTPYVLPNRTPRGGKYRYFRSFWPRMALGTYRNPGAGPKTEKCNFPVLGTIFWGGFQKPRKFLPESAQLFYILHFGQPDPHGREIAQ